MVSILVNNEFIEFESCCIDIYGFLKIIESFNDDFDLLSVDTSFFALECYLYWKNLIWLDFKRHWVDLDLVLWGFDSKFYLTCYLAFIFEVYIFDLIYFVIVLFFISFVRIRNLYMVQKLFKLGIVLRVLGQQN